MKVFKQIGRRTISGGERAKENNRKAILVIFPPSILNDMPHIIRACDERLKMISSSVDLFHSHS